MSKICDENLGDDVEEAIVIYSAVANNKDMDVCYPCNETPRRPAGKYDTVSNARALLERNQLQVVSSCTRYSRYESSPRNHHSLEADISANIAHSSCQSKMKNTYVA